MKYSQTSFLKELSHNILHFTRSLIFVSKAEVQQWLTKESILMILLIVWECR